MNKRFLAVIVAALLAFGVMGLAACSGGSSSGSGGGSKSEKSKSVEEILTCEWELAAVEYQDCTVGGDLSQLMGGDLTIELEKDGKATLVRGSEKDKGTWEVKGNDVSITDSSGATVEGEYIAKDGSLKLDMGAVSSNFKGMILILVNDDSTYEAPYFDKNDAESLSSLKDAEGKWEMSGVAMQGIHATGDVSGIVGGDMALEINSDGTCTFSSGANKLNGTVEANGKGVFLTLNGTQLEVLKLDGNIAIDFTPAGMSALIIFS